MPVTTKTPLGATTLNRKWRVDVNTGTTAVPVWAPLRGIGEFTPTTNYTTQDTSDFDSEGFMSDTVTALGWGLEAKANRKTDEVDPAAYDVAQEAVRLAAEVMGLGNVVEVRYYEDNGSLGPKVQAYQGLVGTQWAEDGGDMSATSSVSLTLSGQGRRVPITHPADVPALAPSVTAIDPTTGPTAGGTLVLVTGTDFTGATAVNFGAVAAAQFDVISKTKISVISPAATAGIKNVTVVTPAGTSTVTAANAFTYA